MHASSIIPPSSDVVYNVLSKYFPFTYCLLIPLLLALFIILSLSLPLSLLRASSQSPSSKLWLKHPLLHYLPHLLSSPVFLYSISISFSLVHFHLFLHTPSLPLLLFLLLFLLPNTISNTHPFSSLAATTTATTAATATPRRQDQSP